MNFLIVVGIILAAVIKYVVVPVFIAAVCSICICGLFFAFFGVYWIVSNALYTVFHAMHKVTYASKVITAPIALAIAVGASTLLFVLGAIPAFCVCQELETVTSEAAISKEEAAKNKGNDLDKRVENEIKKSEELLEEVKSHSSK